MLPERPRTSPARCPVCGRPVDPLRAPRVLWMEDGARFLCGEPCKARFLDGEREHDEPSRTETRRTTSNRPSIPDLVREATRPRDSGRGELSEERAGHRYDPLIAVALGALALAISLSTASREVGWLSAFSILLCAAVNIRIPLHPLRATRSMRAVAPVGLVLAVLGAILAPDPEAQRWALGGAALAALVVSVRNVMHALVLRPVGALFRELRSTLPRTARVPAQDPSAYDELPTAQLQPGDLVVVLEGERAPGDGVVVDGEAVGLRFPKASTSASYADGDFILAGARIDEGAITVRIRRSGDERAIVRATEIGIRERRARGSTSRFRLALTQWSWLVLGPMALGLLIWVGPSAAGAWLLGAPILALLASLDTSLSAGALAAAKRGMFFGDAAALGDSGRIGTAAVLLRGALTAGEPMVQQVKALGTMRIERVLALAAAAEGPASSHPVARAIRRYADEHGSGPAVVRKEKVLAGLGVTAVTSHGARVVVGRRQLLLDEGVSVAAADQDAKHVENEGLTPIFVAVDGNLEALLAILDPLHVGARDAIKRISDLPCEVVILSGDDRRTVERIAANLGASSVKAPLLPRERANEVRALRETGGLVAALGRGGADDAVLAAAHVPVALGLAGTALEDRGLAIASCDVRDAADALWIARAVRRSTWRSLAASSVIALLVAAGTSLGFMAPVAAALLATAADAWALRTGSRLLRRVDLRVPTRQ